MMPSTVADQSVSRMVLSNAGVEPYHALLEEIEGQLRLTDRGSRTGSKVNGVALPFQAVVAGDRLQMGAVEITVVALVASSPAAKRNPAAPPPPPRLLVTPVSERESSGAASETTASPTAEIWAADGTCNRQIGFLIKRRCGRTTSEGCRYCRNGQVDESEDPYRDDYDLYPGYGRYGRSYWGYHYYSNRDRYYYDPDSRRVDFTEADAASFENERDQDYEVDLDAS